MFAGHGGHWLYITLRSANTTCTKGTTDANGRGLQHQHTKRSDIHTNRLNRPRTQQSCPHNPSDSRSKESATENYT